MTTEERAAAIAEGLAALGLRALVMGGHAVRFYGVDRSTIDYDFCLAVEPEEWKQLASILRRSPVIAGSAFREDQSWRPDAFRRFVIGRTDTGREERLEVWRRNHLLAPFDQLFERRTEGLYGGHRLAFLGLDDLIHSKETEREDDWRDVGLLEEIADERRLATAVTEEDRVRALGMLRSRRGFERALSAGWLDNDDRVRRAAASARHILSRAYLLPSVSRIGLVIPLSGEVSPVLIEALRDAQPGSARHLALVEAVRRLYRRACMAADRADKEREHPEPAV